MTVTSTGSADREGTPAGYREALYWRIGDSRRQVIILNLLALLSLVPWLFLFAWLGFKVGRIPQSGDVGLPQIGLVLAGGLLTLILHELGHGLAMSAFGAHTRYGVLWTGLMVYATAPGHAFPRSAYVAISLAPLVGLSLLAVLGMVLLAGTQWATLLVFCAAANASGAIGDLWILSVVLRYPPSARMVDERDGVRILLPL